jgi:hypothetical protein
MQTDSYRMICQRKEWYGEDDQIGNPAFGRHKNKGGEEFIFEVPCGTSIDREALIESWNARYDQPNLFYRYEALDIEYYWAPTLAKLVDGELIVS